jgi:hypothetical protein
VALSAPDSLKGTKVTRAQRAALSPALRRRLGLHEAAGHPIGASPYALDDMFVRLAIREMRIDPELDPTSAARRVLARVDELGQREMLRKAGLLNSESADVERIGDKVRRSMSDG